MSSAQLTAAAVRAELAEILIEADETADQTVLRVIDRLAHVRQSLADRPVPPPVHDSKEFLDWLRS